MFWISSVDESDCAENSGELGGIAVLFSASKIGCSYSHSHALVYNSSHSCTMKHLRLFGDNFAYQKFVGR